MEWIKTEDSPLVIATVFGWECTENGEKEFLAAVPHNDSRHPGHTFWWIKHCVIEDGKGLCVVGEDDNEPAAWQIDDITHYAIIEPPKQ